MKSTTGRAPAPSSAAHSREPKEDSEHSASGLPPSPATHRARRSFRVPLGGELRRELDTWHEECAMVGATTLEDQYALLDGRWASPFPPPPPGFDTRFLKISLQPLRGKYSDLGNRVSKFAEVKGDVHLSFRRHNEPWQRWTGTVVSVHGPLCRVYWPQLRRVLPFPPPRHAPLEVRRVFFTPRPLRRETHPPGSDSVPVSSSTHLSSRLLDTGADNPLSTLAANWSYQFGRLTSPQALFVPGIAMGLLEEHPFLAFLLCAVCAAVWLAVRAGRKVKKRRKRGGLTRRIKKHKKRDPLTAESRTHVHRSP
jgi:hypothetical protein